VAAARLVGVVLPPYDTTSGGLATGPFYFKAGEKPVMLAIGSSPTDVAFCGIQGTISQTI
jgi:hypothetical protein